MKISKGTAELRIDLYSAADARRAIGHHALKTDVCDVKTRDDHRRLIARLERLTLPYGVAIITPKV